jgi:hypothetical protein
VNQLKYKGVLKIVTIRGAIRIEFNTNSIDVTFTHIRDITQLFKTMNYALGPVLKNIPNVNFSCKNTLKLAIVKMAFLLSHNAYFRRNHF